MAEQKSEPVPLSRSDSGRLERNHYLNAKSLRHHAAGGQLATRLPRTCTHAHHAEAGTVNDFSSLIGQALAVVLNGEQDVLIPMCQADLHHRGFRMPGDVGEGLLGDAEEVRFRFICKPPRKVRVLIHYQTRALAEFFRQPAQSGIQAKIIQNDGPQQMRKFAYVGDGFIDQMQAVGAQ